jgi:hypothetical protein
MQTQRSGGGERRPPEFGGKQPKQQGARAGVLCCVVLQLCLYGYNIGNWS